MHKFLAACVLFTTVFAASLFAQNNIVSPNAPVVPVAPVAPITSAQMPQMPLISSPVAASNFYTPGNQYLQNENNQEKNDAQKSTSEQKSEASVTAALERILTGSSAVDFSGLTAWDLTQLAQRGAISNISSLSAFTNTSDLSSLNQLNQQKILSQILTELEQIKKAQKDLISAPQTGTKPSQLPPRILRFVVNANDVLANCTQVYFSEQESDGTFLMTGDARTLVQNESVAETFYLLFKASGTENFKIAYNVAPTLSQNGKNKIDESYSTPLERFCSTQNLTASRAGNLVMLHYNDNDNVFDLLLDIGKPIITSGSLN